MVLAVMIMIIVQFLIKVLRNFLSLGSMYIDAVKLDTDGPSIGSSS